MTGSPGISGAWTTAPCRWVRSPADRIIRGARVLRVDILILCLLLATVVLVLRGARRGWILGIWFLTLVLMLGLFRYHVTSPLDLSF